MNTPVTPEQVRNIYTQNIGREPIPQEMAHHASNKTGLEHLTTWAQQQGGATPQQPQQVGLSTVLTSMLKNFQKFNSADRYTQLYKQNRELQEAQGMRAISPVGGSATLSPSQRATIRGGSAAALGPQVTASADVIKGKQAAATQFLNAINVARGLGKDMEDLKTQQEEKAMEGLKLLAYSDSPISQTQISQVANLTGYDIGALTGYVAELQRQAQGQKTLDDLELALKRKELNKPYYEPKDKEEPLGILDIQRYNELYPDAGVITGDTQSQADAKVIASRQPKEYTDEEFRTFARDDKANNKPYEEVIASIDSNQLIINKDRAKLIVSEIYGKDKEKKGLLQTIFGGGTKKETTNQIQPGLGLGTQEYFGNLNNQILDFNKNYLGR